MKALKRSLPAVGTALALTASLAVPAFAAEGGNSGIAVQLNGQNLSFTDAAPEAVSGRTFLPVRAVSEAMGAQVTYDAATQRITAVRDGITLDMTVGSKQATVTENGETRTVELDAAAYSKNNRAYVPVRFAAEAFGCIVGWDQTNQTVLIVEPEKLLGDATFDLLDNYSAYAKEQMGDHNQALEGDFSLTLSMDSSLTGTEEDLSLPLSAEYSGVSTTTAGQMKMTLDLSSIADLVSDSDLSAQELKEGKEALKDIEVEARFDLDTGMYYIHCPLLAELLGQPSADSTWFSMDLNSLLAASGMDLSELMELSNTSALSMKDALTETFSAMPLTSIDDYAILSETAKMYVDMFSDEAFTKSGNTYTSTLSMTDNGSALTLKTTLTASGDDIVGMAMDMDVSAVDAATGDSTPVLKMDISSDCDATSATMEMGIPGLMSLSMEINTSTSSTDEEPVTTLPEGAVVVDLLAAMA